MVNSPTLCRGFNVVKGVVTVGRVVSAVLIMSRVTPNGNGFLLPVYLFRLAVTPHARRRFVFGIM